MTWLRNFFAYIYDILLGCRHASLTRPFTIEEETYEVCLDCGKQLYYSLDMMRTLSAREVRHLRAARSNAEVTMIPAATPRQAMAGGVHNSNAAA